MVIINNIKYWATGKILNPSSSHDDGRLDCCLVKPCSLFKLIRLSRLSQKKRLSDAAEISFLRSENFDVSSEKSFTIQVDGELIGGFQTPLQFHEVSFRSHPKACPFICGEGI
jgi:diacylglycerol kinase family enzyme